MKHSLPLPQVAALHPQLVERLAVLCMPHPACFLPNMDFDQMKRCECARQSWRRGRGLRPGLVGPLGCGR